MADNRQDVEQPESGAKESSGLRFDTSDDALDFARDCVERSKHWRARKYFNLAEDYVKGATNLVIQFRTTADPQKFCLVLRRIPSVVSEARRANDRPCFDVGAVTHRRCSQGDKHAVCFDVSGLVETPQGLIPSLVWLEIFKEHPYPGRDVNQLPVQFVVHVEAGGGEGERGPLVGASRMERDSASINGMIKSIPEVGKSILGDRRKLPRNLSETQLVNILTCTRVIVDDKGIWLALDEALDPSIEIIDVIPRSLDNFARTIESIGHDEDQEGKAD